MGNAMYYYKSGIDLYMHPDVTPGPFDKPTFEPDLGFSGPRKERAMIATQEEMESAKLPLDKRDYCAHLLIKYLSCRKDAWPWPVKCEHEQHTYLTCQHEDFTLRMKEYERERRLRVRQKQGSN